MHRTPNEIILEIKSETDVFKKIRLIEFLRQDSGLRLVEIAKMLDIKPSYLSNLMRLTSLPEIIIDSYYSNTLSLSHLIILSRLKSENEQIYLFERCLELNLSVHQLEEEVRIKLHGMYLSKNYLSEGEKAKIEEKIKKIDSSIKVKIIQSRIKSKLIITVEKDLDSFAKFIKKLTNHL